MIINYYWFSELIFSWGNFIFLIIINNHWFCGCFSTVILGIDQKFLLSTFLQLDFLRLTLHNVAISSDSHFEEFRIHRLIQSMFVQYDLYWFLHQHIMNYFFFRHNNASHFFCLDIGSKYIYPLKSSFFLSLTGMMFSVSSKSLYVLPVLTRTFITAPWSLGY